MAPSNRARASSAADSFAALLSRSSDVGPAELVGLEHEFTVHRGAEVVDFRGILPTLRLEGLPIDPGDPYARRCAWGGVVTADDGEAEIAIPPVEARAGFPQEIDVWARTGRAELERALPDDLSLRGYSTHLSVAMPGTMVERVSRRYARRFAPALMLLMDRASSPGLLIRPRPSRVELGAEHVEGRTLRVAAAFAVGSVAACAAAGRSRQGLPPRIRARLAPAILRYGWYVDRRAFGADLYERGRATPLRRSGRGTLTAQEHLEAAWEAARRHLDGTLSVEELTEVDRTVEGSLPIPLEGGDQDERRTARPTPPGPFGAAFATRRRPGFSVAPHLLAWDFGVFELVGPRVAYACVPRADLERFLIMLDDGRLDRLIDRFLAESASGRILAEHDQTGGAGLYDAVGAAEDLVAREREPTAISGSSSLRAGKRRGKRSRRREPRRQRTPRRHRLIPAAVAGAIVAASLVVGGVALSHRKAATSTPSPVGSSGPPVVEATISLALQPRLVEFTKPTTLTGTLPTADPHVRVVLEADRFPFTGAFHQVASTTTDEHGAFTFKAKQPAATRYFVALADDPSVRSETRTAYVQSVSLAYTCWISPRNDASVRYPCGNDTIPPGGGEWTVHVTVKVRYPADAYPTESVKTQYVYFGQRKGSREEPDTLQLNQKVLPRPNGTNVIQITYSIDFTTPSSPYSLRWASCNRDTETVDGFGLPEHHHCGDPSITRSQALGYLG